MAYFAEAPMLNDAAHAGIPAIPHKSEASVTYAIFADGISAVGFRGISNLLLFAAHS